MTAMLAIAGIAAPTLFTAIVIAQGALYPRYSHVAEPISALSDCRYGWVQNLIFIISGSLISAFAVGLHIGVAPGDGGVTAPALLVLSGFGLVIAGVFPWKAPGEALAAFLWHSVGTFLAFMGSASGLIVMSWRMQADPDWQDLAAYAHASGVATVILFAIYAALGLHPKAPLNPWSGLIQRVTIGVWFVATLVLAFHLLGVALMRAA